MNDSNQTWKRTHYSKSIDTTLNGTEVTIIGWISSIREHSNIKFITVNDRFGSIQVTLKEGEYPSSLESEIVENQIDWRQPLMTGLALLEAPLSALPYPMLLQGGYGYGNILRLRTTVPLERRLRPGFQSSRKRPAGPLDQRLAALRHCQDWR